MALRNLKLLVKVTADTLFQNVMARHFDANTNKNNTNTSMTDAVMYNDNGVGCLILTFFHLSVKKRVKASSSCYAHYY